jgi:hypothetical protein
MKILIACEESQIVCKAFRERGHEAYSCDLQDCSGGHPEWHLKMDALEALKLMEWSLCIAFPPCTYLTYAGLIHWNQPGRDIKRLEALKFFKDLYWCGIPIAIENPVGYINTVFRPADQTFHPYHFGDPHVKRICLWLNGLPKLQYDKNAIKPEPLSTHKRKPSKNFKGGELKKNYYVQSGKTPKNSKIRSKFWPGVARAMAEQWG